MEIFANFMHALGMYYGLDWIALMTGISGSYLITNRNRWGFFISGAGCIAGFAVAMMSHQFGFVAYNVIIVAMMVRGFFLWGPSYRDNFEPAE